MAALSKTQREDLMAELGGLRRFCHSLTGNNADADDLLQATVERILQKGMPEDANPLKWSYRVCRNVWIDELRSREVRARYSGDGEQGESSPATEAVAESEREVAAVSRALATLPEEQRQALVLVTVDGKTYAEAAAILDVPVGTIMSRIARARKQLLQKLNPETTGDDTPD